MSNSVQGQDKSIITTLPGKGTGTTPEHHQDAEHAQPYAGSSEAALTDILIDGATGYIGSHLAQALRQGYPLTVRCLVRNGASQQNIDFLQAAGVKIYQANLNENSEKLAEIFSKVDVACHLIGTISPKRGESPESIHIQQTEQFITHCLRAKVSKIVMVSACGANGQSEIAYQRTKWHAEQVLKNSGIPAIILRPSLVIGKTTGLRNSKLVSRLQDLIEHKQAVPLVAGGHNKLQPLFINDLIEAIINSIFKIKGGIGNDMPIFELGGSEVLTLRDLTMRLMKVMDKERSILDLPPPVALAVAYSSEVLQGVPMLSRDQVKLSLQDNLCFDNQLPALINRVPTSIEDSLSSYKQK
jgi:nucleoside-diphosphate-sugar epimerase